MQTVLPFNCMDCAKNSGVDTNPSTQLQSHTRYDALLVHLNEGTEGS
jgi:hypothetical protein